MDFSILIPTPGPIPANWKLIQLFLLLTFIIHIIFVNLLIGSSIIVSTYLIWFRKNNDFILKQIGKKIPIIMTFTINTGIAPLLFIHVLYGQFIFTSSILMAVWWLSTIPLMIVAYYLMYMTNLKPKYISPIKIYIIISVVILIVGFILSNNMTLMLKPQKWINYFEIENGTLTNLNDPMLIPRYLHFVCASISVGGLFLAWLEYLNNVNLDKKINQNMRWFTIPTTIQIPIGILFFLSLSPEIRIFFCGQNIYGTTLLLLSIISTLISLFFGYKNKLIPCTIFSLFTISTMVLVRDMVRKTYLMPFFKPNDLIVKNQKNSLMIFMAMTVIVVVSLIYVAKIAKQKDEGK